MNGLTEVSVEIEGVSPLLMHNAQLADPTNQFTKDLKDISSRRKKTDQDHAEMKRIEYMGGLYYSDDIGVFVPAEWVEGVICSGAKVFRQGKLIASGVRCNEDLVKLNYTGPRKPEALFDDPKFVDTRGVVLQRARIMRTRPRFNEWSVKFSLTIIEDVISTSDVQRALETAGLRCGMGDFRPRYGRFIVKSFS